MNAERLLQLYDQVCEAPDAIPRLRRFVLDLAVRGKLAEQNLDDEPVSDLLKRVEIDRQHRCKARKVRKSSGDSNVGHVLHPIPPNWRWLPLGDLGYTQTGATPPKSHPEHYGDYIPFLRPGNLFESYVDYSGGGLSAVGIKASGRLAQPGSVLMVCIGTIGKCQILDRSASFNQQLNSISPYADTNPQFLLRMLQAPYFQDAAWHSSARTTIAILNKSNWEKIPVPLAPLAEQHRIVAKVDELMALCDNLEAERKKREATRDRLTTASLSRLTAPDVDEKQFKAHADFAIKVLPELTFRPDQIKALRQTILDLAVRGKLVEQDPSEESSSALLIRLQRGRNTKRKAIQSDTNEETQLLPSLPDSWTWTIVDQIAADEENAITDGPFGAKLKTAHYVSEPGCRVIRLQNIGRGVFREEHRSFIDREHFDSLSKHHVKPGDLVVAGLVDSGVRCAEVPTSIARALVKADCYRLAVHPELCARFFLHYLNSPLARDFASAHHHGMTLTRIGLGNFRKLAVPLPPASEQIRIVAKVGGLMAFCDDLEHALTAGEDSRGRLLEALLVEGLEPAARWAA